MRKPSAADLKLVPMSYRCPKCHHWPLTKSKMHNSVLGCAARSDGENGKICGCKYKP
jgi:hypothetical protein